jgi:predicted Zn-dependent peptidase
LPAEPAQQQARVQEVKANVPLDALYKAWHCGGRLDPSYHATDLITEIMGSGGSSRLHQRLVKEQRLFSHIECYHFGSIDPGLMVMEGKLVKGVAMQMAEAALQAEVEKLLNDGVTESELQKAKNKTESLIAFEDLSLMNRANNLAYYALLGDAQMMNTEWQKYQRVTLGDLQEVAHQIFRPANSNTLHYLAAS